MAIKVISPGLATSVQDLGRPGYFFHGTPTSEALTLSLLRALKISVHKEYISMVFFQPGDIVKFKSIGREAYDQDVADVEAGRFAPLVRDVTFSLDAFNADIDGYNKNLGEILHGN